MRTALAKNPDELALKFDWDLAENQFSVESGYFRPPELEIYGRSLSTPRRLGAFMVAHAIHEIIGSPEAEQAKVEFFTSVQEGFGTDEELGAGLEVRDFETRPVIGGKVMARDSKTAIATMTAAGLACALEKYKVELEQGDHRFLPQLMRSACDHDNALAVDKMARGETDYNTVIVVSPFVEEAAAESGDKYWQNIGYVPGFRRGFVQLYHNSEGGVLTGSLSFDGSDKRVLREIFRQYGVEIPEYEITDNWLKYPIKGNFSTSKSKELAVNIANQAEDPKYKKNTNTVAVTKAHHAIMKRAFNESYIHICESLATGYQTPDTKVLISQLARNAGSFNDRYANALFDMTLNQNNFTDDNMVVLHELLVYSTIEMMRALHLEQAPAYSIEGALNTAAFLQIADPAQFQNMLGRFGADGARNNRVYSACGIKIAAGGDNEASGTPQAAYGGADGGESSSGIKKMTCPQCKATVYGDPCATELKCWDCKAFAKNGKLVYKGDGGHYKRAHLTAVLEEKRRKRRLAKIAERAERAERRAEAAAKVNAAFNNAGLNFGD